MRIFYPDKKVDENKQPEKAPLSYGRLFVVFCPFEYIKKAENKISKSFLFQRYGEE